MKCVLPCFLSPAGEGVNNAAAFCEILVFIPCAEGSELASGGRSCNDPVSQLLSVRLLHVSVLLVFPLLIRYVNWCRWHREGAYDYLMNEKDVKTLEAVRAFNPYDLYSKSDEPCDVDKLRPYYEGLIAKFFPPELDW